MRLMQGGAGVGLVSECLYCGAQDAAGSGLEVRYCFCRSGTGEPRAARGLERRQVGRAG